MLFNNRTSAQNCEQTSKHLSLYKEKFGDLTKFETVEITNNFKNVDFSLLSCFGDKKSQTVTIVYTLLTKDVHQRLTIYGTGSQSTAIDFKGNQFPVKEVSIGLESSPGWLVTNKLSTDVPLKGTITFSNILPNVPNFSSVSINLSTASFDGGFNEQQSVVEVKNLPISWAN